MKTSNFYTTKNAQDYVNFINDHDLGDSLKNYETGFMNGSFFIDITGSESLIESIKNRSIKKPRGKYIRSSEHKKLQSKIQLEKSK